MHNSPVFHVIDESNYYQAPRRLSTVSKDAIWPTPRIRWVDINLDPPDVFKHDAGENFIAQAFQQQYFGVNIRGKMVPLGFPSIREHS